MGLFGNLFGGKKKEETPSAGSGHVCEPKTVYSPLKGTVIPLDQVDDPVFAGGMMGLGVGIEPAEGKLYAPADGEVAALFPTGHAVGLNTKDGMELLLHIGINTVEMQGDGFKIHTKQGAKVKAGELLVEFDIAKIEKAGFKATTMVLVSNAPMMGEMTAPEMGAAEPLKKLFAFK